MEKIISVIVPVYNAENYVGRCIESVQAQTYTKWQMILIDDGSKDGSLSVCKKYSDIDERIQVIHQENAGAGAARNTGLSHANGDYIVFVDSDDYIDKDYFLLLSRHDEDVVFIDVQAVDDSGKRLRDEFLSVYKTMQKDDFMRSQMTGKINWGGVRKVVKRSLLEEYHIRYTDHKVGEEALFTYNSVYNAKTISFIEKPLYFYIQREDSLSHTKMDDPWGEVALALKEETLKNGSYSEYADTINAFLLTAVAVSADRLATNYSYRDYLSKVSHRMQTYRDSLDSNVNIDYSHMSNKAKLLGYLLNKDLYTIVWLISKAKHCL